MRNLSIPLGWGLELFLPSISYCSCASFSTSTLSKKGKTKANQTKSSPSKGKSKEPTVLGRVGTSLKVGVVGVPNVGKSTLFNVLTDSQVAAENFPFCTIDPNESRVGVRDERFNFLCDLYRPKIAVPGYLKVVDIAGLIAGASKGKGLGNAFLSHISACDAIFHVVRAFEDINVVHSKGNFNPLDDLETILSELRYKDIQYFSRRFFDIEKKYRRSGDPCLEEEFVTIEKVLHILEEEEKQLRFVKDWQNPEIEILNRHLPLTAKPIIYLANLSHDDFVEYSVQGRPTGPRWYQWIQQWVDTNDPGSQVIPFSSAFEQNLKMNYLKGDEENIPSVLPKIIQSGLDILQLRFYFTVGADEVKAWSVQSGTKAPVAAGKIHSDIEKYFIMAEVMHVNDLIELGSEQAVKGAGKYFKKGKEYVISDGDIINFRFNAPKGPTKGVKKKR